MVSADFKILDSVSSNNSSRSWISSKTSAFLSLSWFLMSINSSCLVTSRFTISAIMSKSCTPLISTRAPSAMEMFRSCLIVPRPLLTLVLLKIWPSIYATSRTWSGWCIEGSVVISARGIPKRSSLNSVNPSLVSTLLAASSSRPRLSMTTLPYGVSRYPSVATIPVLWNPPVLLPSITCFLIVWNSSTICIFIKHAIVIQMSSASSFKLWGGSSSFSTRHVCFSKFSYLKFRPLKDSWRAALSISPSSDWVGLNFLWTSSV